MANRLLLPFAIQKTKEKLGNLQYWGLIKVAYKKKQKKTCSLVQLQNFTRKEKGKLKSVFLVVEITVGTIHGRAKA